MTRRRPRLSVLYSHPARAVVSGFVAAITVGGLLLLLPFAAEPGRDTSTLVAFFTATSAVCVTGLAVVDTGSHWSAFGELVILGLIQIGGFGIVALSMLLLGAFSKSIGLRYRIIAATETGAGPFGDVRRILRALVRLTLAVEAVAAITLTGYFVAIERAPMTDAVRNGVFLAVSAFNNAGFSLLPTSLVEVQDQSIVLLTIAATIIVGGLGLPVWLDLADHRTNARRWSLHTKLTVSTTIGLLVVPTVLFAWFEWTNTATFGQLSTWDSGVNAFFAAVTPRTAGFNAVPITGLNEASLLLTETLMYIGGGSASTAGGIKVSTVAVLGWVIWAEARGEPDTVVFRRRIPVPVIRQAVTVTLVAIVVVVLATLLLVATTGLRRADLQFEAISALATVGLSEDLTPSLPSSARLVIMGLMLLGRVGPMTLAAALVARSVERRTRPPEEAPIIG